MANKQDPHHHEIAPVESDPLVPNPELYNLPFTTDEFNGMPYRRLGNAGLRVSNIGLGTWKFGFPETGDGSRVGEKVALRLFDEAVEAGVTFWDTANRYNNSSGNSERLIGRWLAANPSLRRTVEIATKLYGGMDGRTPNYCRLSRANVLEAVYACLDRLQTDHIDLLQIHWFDETTPIPETLGAVEDLVRQDLVRYFGLSNCSVAQVEAYRAWADIFLRAPVVSVQNRFDILCGEEPARPGVLPHCAAHGMSFIAWSPLRGGLISDRYLDRSALKPGDRLVDEKLVDQELTEDTLKKLGALSGAAKEAELTTAQLAMAYMLRLPGMGPLIASASTPEQLRENAKAGRVHLAEDLVQTVDKILRG
jgi:aryl-alcohol dehydrogenase-like predicted oxidoreductase